MKKIWIVVGLMGVLLLVLAFWWLDFHLARSATQSDLQFSAYRSGKELPPQVAPGAPLDYAVVDSGMLAQALHDELSQQLQADPAFSNVTAVTPTEQSANPFAFIEGEPIQVTWSPFYATARVSVTVVYASDGDISWRHDPVVRFNSSDGPIVRTRGTFVFENRAWGIFSYEGYHTLLAEQMGQEIDQLLRDLLLQPERFGWTE